MVAELQKVLYGLLEEQAKVLMLAQAREQYAFKIVDPPIVADEKIGPKRLLTLLFSGFVGFALGASIALAIPAKRRKTASAAHI